MGWEDFYNNAGNDNAANFRPIIVFVNDYSSNQVRFDGNASTMPLNLPDVRFVDSSNSFCGNRYSENYRDNRSGWGNWSDNGCYPCGSNSDYYSGDYRTQARDNHPTIRIRLSLGDFDISASTGDAPRRPRYWARPFSQEPYCADDYAPWSGRRHNSNYYDRRFADIDDRRDFYKRYNHRNDDSNIAVRLNLGRGNILSGMFNI